MILIFLFFAVLGSIAGAIIKNNYENKLGRISFKFTRKDFFKTLPITILIVIILYLVSLFNY